MAGDAPDDSGALTPATARKRKVDFSLTPAPLPGNNLQGGTREKLKDDKGNTISYNSDIDSFFIELSDGRKVVATADVIQTAVAEYYFRVAKRI